MRRCSAPGCGPTSARYAFGNASFADLIACWTQAGGRDLDRWAESWLRTSGLDTIEVRGELPDVSLASRGPDGPSRRRHAITVAAIDRHGAVRPVSTVTLGHEPVPVRVPNGAVLVLPDATDQTWAKIRFSQGDWSGLSAVLPLVTDELALVVLYNTIRDSVRNAELAPEVALDLCCAGLPRLGSVAIMTSVLQFALDQLAGAYCPAEGRSARTAVVHALARDLLAGSPSGSDRQLTAFRVTVRSATDDWLLRRWSAGEQLPPGISLDPELGWRIVHRRAAVGADPRCISEALARDSSASAVVHATRARAARPDPDAKAAAWRAVMQPSSYSAYEIYALCEGFFEPEQTELTLPYAERYFDEIRASASFRNGWSLGEVAAKAYPWSVTTRGGAGARRRCPVRRPGGARTAGDGGRHGQAAPCGHRSPRIPEQQRR